MQKSILQSVIARLQACKGEWPSVADKSGVPLRTIEKIARGEIANPGINSVQRLLNYFSKS